jgi:hypothetical protein
VRLIGLLAACLGVLHAGPPFQTDDPEPVDFKHFEAYLFSTRDGTQVGSAYQGPAFEMNWGAVPDVQLHLVVPAACFVSPGLSAFGIGDTELGVKYRFIHETKFRPEFGIFPFLELPSGSARAGLGNGRAWTRLPLWAQKSAGPWTTYGGGGEALNSAPGMRNYAFVGWLVQRDIGKKLTLGTEVFHHGAEGTAALSTRDSTLIDAGGYYYFRKPAFQLLFMAGHSVTGQTESVAYLGLYWTWGGDAPAKSAGLLHEHAGL